MALIRCGSKRWRRVVNTIHINKTNALKTYTFQNPIRNPKIYCEIKGNWTGRGSGGTAFQVGFGGDVGGVGYWWYPSGTGATKIYKQGSTGTGDAIPIQITDNVKRTSITTGPFTAVWGDLSNYSSNVQTSDIWITEYEELK